MSEDITDLNSFDDSVYYKEPVLGTREVGEILDLNPDMVRYYVRDKDFEDLFPDCTEDEKGKGVTRRGNLKMSSKDVEILREILKYKDAGYSKHEIRKRIGSNSTQIIHSDLNDSEKFKQLMATEDFQRFIAAVASEAVKSSVDYMNLQQKQLIDDFKEYTMLSLKGDDEKSAIIEQTLLELKAELREARNEIAELKGNKVEKKKKWWQF